MIYNFVPFSLICHIKYNNAFLFLKWSSRLWLCQLEIIHDTIRMCFVYFFLFVISCFAWRNEKAKPTFQMLRKICSLFTYGELQIFFSYTAIWPHKLSWYLGHVMMNFFLESIQYWIAVYYKYDFNVATIVIV